MIGFQERGSKNCRYVVIVLRADDHGEGGTFALYARLARVARLPTPTATEAEYNTQLARVGAKLAGGVRPGVATHVRSLPPFFLILGSGFYAFDRDRGRAQHAARARRRQAGGRCPPRRCHVRAPLPVLAPGAADLDAHFW